MRSLIHAAVMAGAVLAGIVMTTPLYAQIDEPLTFTTDFAFIVNGKTMPAGRTPCSRWTAVWASCGFNRGTETPAHSSTWSPRADRHHGKARSCSTKRATDTSSTRSGSPTRARARPWPD